MRRQCIFAFVLLSVLLAASTSAQESEPVSTTLLGDHSDGSRAIPVHLVPLYAEGVTGDKGPQVTPDMSVVLPFSTKWTCGECHSYETISQGWHFDALDSSAPIGRSGEPWVYFDVRLGIQVPLSYRLWRGTLRPQQIGMTEYRFTQIFGRHMPGGGPGEIEAEDIDDIGSQLVSGKLEINCLACHNGHYGQDQGGTMGYAVQVSRLNYRWAAAGSCEFATVTGSAASMPPTFDPFMPEGGANEPRVTYRPEAFDADGQVLFDIVREVPDHRCYYCHSEVYYTAAEAKGHREGSSASEVEGHADVNDANAPAEADLETDTATKHGTEKWAQDEDVHLKAGLTCVDCHGNGLEHDIVRGFPQEESISQNPLAATTSCESCHLPEGSGIPDAGRLGAPAPEHVGLPPVHFDVLSCTACHSGPWPGDRTVATKTSRTHRLGTPNVNKSPEVLPHIVSPVYAVGQTGKIAPHKMIWPAYWATWTEDGRAEPLTLDVVERAVGPMFEELDLPENGSWPQRSIEQVREALTLLTEAVDSPVVYVAGGSLYSLSDRDPNEVIERADHRAAKPYMWPIAHSVRPASQSLGVRYCTDCHSTSSPFFFGAVAVDSPVTDGDPKMKKQLAFQGISPVYAWAFSASFVFRPWFKVIAIGAIGIIGLVLLLYGLKALGAVAKTLAEDE